MRNSDIHIPVLYSSIYYKPITKNMVFLSRFSRSHSPPREQETPRIPAAESDGAWYCHKCRYVNFVKKSDGSNPFGDLRCHLCNHVLCRYCGLAEILEVIKDRQPDPLRLVTTTKDQSLPFGNICPKCGRTHRVRHEKERDSSGAKKYRVMFKHSCGCGMKDEDNSWLRFKVGKTQGTGFYQSFLGGRVARSQQYAKDHLGPYNPLPRPEGMSDMEYLQSVNDKYGPATRRKVPYGNYPEEGFTVMSPPLPARRPDPSVHSQTSSLTRQKAIRSKTNSYAERKRSQNDGRFG